MFIQSFIVNSVGDWHKMITCCSQNDVGISDINKLFKQISEEETMASCYKIIDNEYITMITLK